MNLDITLDEIEVDVDVEEKGQEKTVCARLIFTKEQVIYKVKFKMENALLELSITAEISEKDIEDIQHSIKHNTVEARLFLTEAQKKDLHEAFDLLDFKGEGKIKAEDFRVAIKALGYEPTKEELQNMISAVDKGQTGKLSFENFETAIMRKVMSVDTDGDVMKSFRLFDVDDTGFISFENLRDVTQILGENLTDEEIEEMIDDADKDFDGYISVQEFMKMIRNSVNIVTP